MSQTPAITTALAAGSQPEDVLTKEEYAALVKQAESATPESINAMTVNPPPLQSSKLVAKHTFSAFFKMLDALRTAYATAPIDCSTTAGEDAARKIWRKLVTLRTRADKVRLDQSRFFIEHRDANNDEYKMLEDTIRPLEQRYEDAIRERERAQEAARKQREEEAQARAQGITQFILDISSHADNLVGLTSADIAARIQTLTLVEVNEAELDHRFGEAVTIKDRTIARLEAARAEKEEAEKNAEQVAADRVRYAAEKEARDAIDRINTMLAAAGGKTASQLEDDIDGLEGIIFEQYQPLEEEARAAVDRALPVLRQTLADKIAAAEKMKRDLEAAAKAEKEAKARTGIASMKAMVADCVGASSASITAAIDKLNGLLMADFEPFAKEAEEEQARVLTSLEKLRLTAQDEERTTAEREAKKLRAEQVQRNLDRLSRIAAVLQEQGFNSASVKAASDAMSIPTAADFDDRVDEAMTSYHTVKSLLAVMFTTAEKAEQEAAEQAKAEQAEREERQRESDSRTRTERAIADNGRAMLEALNEVFRDDAFTKLNAATQAKVHDLLTDIAAAVKG